MHIRRLLTAGAALLALTAVAGCDGDDTAGGGNSGGGTSGAAASSAAPSASASAGGAGGGTTEQGFDGALPEASDTATLARYVDLFTSCKEVRTGEEYDAGHDSSDTAWGADEASDPAWGIEERAVCKDSTHPIALLTVADMTKFQTAAKASGDVFAIGEDFAVVPVGDDQVTALSNSEMAFLTCDPDFSPASGYRTEPALVDGCVISDYWLG